MGRLLPISCLVLLWATGSGCLRVLGPPAFESDFLSKSTCQWKLDRPLNCSAELRLSYWLDFMFFENLTCLPYNTEPAVCTCDLSTNSLTLVDTYRLDLWAGQQLLWGGTFTPSHYVKPKAPENFTVQASNSHSWLLTWSSPYPPGKSLDGNLIYLVNVSQQDDPSQCQTYNVTYTNPTLRLLASTLKPRRSYTARVRALPNKLNGTWSDWSSSVTLYNDSPLTLEQQLALGVGIACVLILFLCLAGYLGVIRVKKLWWDQIPNPAHSTLLAIVIRDSQVSPWEKPILVQEAAERPRWKTCLAKLLPCVLKHGLGKHQGVPKAPAWGAGHAWAPAEAGKTVLRPESVRVERCVELCEAVEGPGAEEEEEEAGQEEEEEEAAVPAGALARLAESLFVDVLGAEAGSPPPAPGPPAGPAPPAPPAAAVVADNPAYRSFRACCGGPGAAEEPGRGEPDGWEQLLRRRVEQMAAAGYRDFAQAVERGARGAEGAGYRALAGAPGGGDAGYKPFRSPEPGQEPPGAPLDELGSGIVYSALTCHLCGRLKQRLGPAELGHVPGAARPCCDCCSGDPASPPGSPPASPAPSGLSRDGKALLARRGVPCVEVA